jgi:hypothetical protein
MMFPREEIEKLTERKNKLESRWAEVQTTYLQWKLSNKDAKEYLEHGFLRRLGTIVRCVQNTFTICPLDLDRKLYREEEIDLRIQLQSHIWNVFGCLDNLAWIWAYEKNIKENGKTISRKKVGLGKNYKIIRESLPQHVTKYLEEKENADWLKLLENLRHALAHRIPLYVPSFVLTSKEANHYQELAAQIWKALADGKLDDCDRLESERDALGRFLPVMTHSFGEKAPVIGFHSSMLWDFDVITELADKLSSSF